jgi:hypothetical protein
VGSKLHQRPTVRDRCKSRDYLRYCDVDSEGVDVKKLTFAGQLRSVVWEEGFFDRRIGEKYLGLGDVMILLSIINSLILKADLGDLKVL